MVLSWEYVTTIPKAEADKAWQDYIDQTKEKIYFTEAKAKLSAFDTQVGGSHYKDKGSSMQPWAIIDAWGLDFYAGNVLKYILRHQYKDGVEDLKKARHYLDRMIEKAEDQTVFDALKKRNAGKYDENPS
jgi:hypothetical protein